MAIFCDSVESKILSLIYHREIQIKSPDKTHLGWLNERTNSTSVGKTVEQWKPCTLLVCVAASLSKHSGCKLGLTICKFYDPETQFPVLYPGESQAQGPRVRSRGYGDSILSCRQSKFMSARRRMNKLCHRMEYYTAVERTDPRK